MTKLKMYASKKGAYKFHVENVYVEHQTYSHEIKIIVCPHRVNLKEANDFSPNLGGRTI